MKLTETQAKALTQFAKDGHFEGYRSTTVEALEWRGVIERSSDGGLKLTDDVGQRVAHKLTSESIGALRPNRLIFRYQHLGGQAVTFDIGQPDYAFWDRARRGQVEGLELAGLFLRPLASKKAAWVLGTLPEATLNDPRAETKLASWLQRQHTTLLLALEEATALGDYYLVVNPDLSLTPVPPHVVEPLVDERDYSQHVGWRITQTYPHPSEAGRRQTVVDEWRGDERLRIVLQDGEEVSRKRYPNPLGCAPVVHIANNADGNSRHGHPEGIALLKALSHYDETLLSAHEGHLKQGRPQPVFERMGNADAIENLLALYGKRKQSENPSTGEIEHYTEIDVTSDDVLLLGGDGTFNFKQPGSFTEDTLNLLQVLFYLMIQHSEIPEFVWGNAISSSHASAQAQLPTFLRWVEKERGRATSWLHQTIEIVLAYWRTTDPARLGDATAVELRWPPLQAADERLRLDAIQLALDNDLISTEQALSLLPLGMERD